MVASHIQSLIYVFRICGVTDQMTMIIRIENIRKFQFKYIPHRLHQHMGYFQVRWKNLVVVQEHYHLPCSERPKVLIFASEFQASGIIPCLNPSFRWCISKLVQLTLTNQICKYSILSVLLKLLFAGNHENNVARKSCWYFQNSYVVKIHPLNKMYYSSWNGFICYTYYKHYYSQ